jgi:hypothetical protein
MKIHQGKTGIQGRQALYRLLGKGGKTAPEAGNPAFIFAREIRERAGSRVRVLNAAKLPFIWDAPVKADKEAAVKPARLIGDNPGCTEKAVWVGVSPGTKYDRTFPALFLQFHRFSPEFVYRN